MSQKSELELLRAVLGRGPANLLVFVAMIADDDGFAGPIPAGHICLCEGIECSKSTLRNWRRKLEEAGLVRVGMSTDNRKGYLYQLRGTESLSLKRCVDEWITEDRTELVQ